MYQQPVLYKIKDHPYQAYLVNASIAFLIHLIDFSMPGIFNPFCTHFNGNKTVPSAGMAATTPKIASSKFPCAADKPAFKRSATIPVFIKIWKCTLDTSKVVHVKTCYDQKSKKTYQMGRGRLKCLNQRLNCPIKIVCFFQIGLSRRFPRLECIWSIFQPNLSNNWIFDMHMPGNQRWKLKIKNKKI